MAIIAVLPQGNGYIKVVESTGQNTIPLNGKVVGWNSKVILTQDTSGYSRILDSKGGTIRHTSEGGINGICEEGVTIKFGNFIRIKDPITWAHVRDIYY